MMKAVQASLMHYNSTDEHPRHHLCPEGETSWCKWQKAKAKGSVYTHKKPPLPAPIVKLLQPIYNRLGSSTLLERCLGGFTKCIILMSTSHPGHSMNTVLRNCQDSDGKYQKIPVTIPEPVYQYN